MSRSLASRLLLRSLEDRLAPAVHTWNPPADGQTHLWSQTANWGASGVPTSGEAGGTVVVFPAGDTSYQDISGLVVDQIQFTTATGSVITLLTPLGLQAGATGSIQIQDDIGDARITPLSAGNVLNLVGSGAVGVNVATGTLTLATAIAGTAGLSISGAGTLALTGTNTYSGDTTVTAGTTILSSTSPNSAVVVTGGLAGGVGTVPSLSVTGGGTVSPGLRGTAPATLTTQKLTFDSGTYAPVISSANGGTADQIIVKGPVFLSTNGPTALSPITVGTPPTNGATLTIINNDGTDAVTGTFAGLPEGATLTVGSWTYTISYKGGDGNDVTLTVPAAVSPPASPPGSPPTSPPTSPPPPGSPPTVPPIVVPTPAFSGPLQIAGPATGTTVTYTTSSTGLLNRTGKSVNFFPGAGVPVQVVVADVNGDGTPDYIGATGDGVPARVTIVDGITGTTTLASFQPYGSSFTGGLSIAAADFNADGKADVVVAPDSPNGVGIGPQILVLNGASLTGSSTVPSLLSSFLGLADLAGAADTTFKGGARIATGDVNGDSVADLLVAAGTSGGPRVTVWSGTGLGFAAGGAPTVNPIANLFVFEASQRGGAYVTAGDMTGDGKADMVFGGGPGGGPRVRIVDSALLLGLPADQLGLVNLDDPVNLATGLVTNNFFVGNGNTRGGIRLAVRDVDGDGLADLITGSGAGLPSQVVVYTATGLKAVAGQNGVAPVANQTIDPFGAVLAAGVYVG